MYLLYIFPLRATHLRLRCSNFFDPSKKILLVVLQIRKEEIGNMYMSQNEYPRPPQSCTDIVCERLEVRLISNFIIMFPTFAAVAD
jgi:hypothetical protein